MITSKDNEQLKQIRRLLRDKRSRARSGLFAAEGEDLTSAASANGWPAEILLEAGVDVEAGLLSAVSALGSGARRVGVYRERWSEPGGDLSVYLHGVRDPGNIGAVIRSIHAFADGPVVLGPGCADPFSPKAVRASMGSLFARPPARGRFEDLAGTTVALDAAAAVALADVVARPPIVLCLGSEREGLPAGLSEQASVAARIPLRPGGPDSLNVAMAATVALYEANRMASDA
ncbi:MAG: RNA methyltransferase [Thermoleophilaceae bacterium]